MILEVLLSILVLAVIAFIVIMLWPKMMPNTNSGSNYSGSNTNSNYDYGVTYPAYTFPLYSSYPTYGYNNLSYGDRYNSGRNYYGYRSL